MFFFKVLLETYIIIIPQSTLRGEEEEKAGVGKLLAYIADLVEYIRRAVI